MRKTILDWLVQDGEPEWKEAAILNYCERFSLVPGISGLISRETRVKCGSFQNTTDSLSKALNLAFTWSQTPEGANYWTNIHSQLQARLL